MALLMLTTTHGSHSLGVKDKHFENSRFGMKYWICTLPFTRRRIDAHWSWMVKHLILLVRTQEVLHVLEDQLMEEEVQMSFSFKSCG